MSTKDYDITPYLMPYMNVHVNMKLLEFLLTKDNHDKESLEKALATLAEKTKLKQEFKVEDYKEDQENFDKIKETCKTSNVSSTQLSSLYNYSKVLFSFGKYKESLDILNFVLNLDKKTYQEALWARLLCNILLEDWEETYKDLDELKIIVKNSALSPKNALSSRICFIHYALLSYLRGGNLDKIYSLFMTESSNLNVVLQTCPYLLRYIIATLIIRCNIRKLEDIASIFSAQETEISDPFVQFVVLLFGECDFVRSNELIGTIYGISSEDYLLASNCNVIKDSAKKMVLEVVLRVHGNISIDDVAKLLGMTKEQILKLSGSECGADGIFHYNAGYQSYAKEISKILSHIEIKTNDLQKLIEEEVKKSANSDTETEANLTN